MWERYWMVWTCVQRWLSSQGISSFMEKWKTPATEKNWCQYFSYDTFGGHIKVCLKLSVCVWLCVYLTLSCLVLSCREITGCCMLGFAPDNWVLLFFWMEGTESIILNLCYFLAAEWKTTTQVALIWLTRFLLVDKLTGQCLHYVNDQPYIMLRSLLFLASPALC